MINRAAVLGSPIGHSLSPALHRAAYRALGLDGWDYQAVELDEARLPSWLAGLGPEWRGLSLTRPLKRAVLGLVDHVQPLAKMVGGANTVLFTPAGTVAANTDVRGIVATVREVAPDREFRSASVIGGGATAAAALAALAELGLRRPRLHVRSLARSQPTLQAAARLGVEPQLRKLGDGRPPVDWPADLTIATLPAHAADGIGGSLDETALPDQAVLLDVAYDPWPSRLAEAWRTAGGLVASGKTMLLHQAAAQVQMMTGHEPPLDQMRAAIS